MQGTNISTYNTGEVQTVKLKCMHCGLDYRMSYDPGKEITAYFASVKTFLGKPCTNPYGHGFIKPKQA